MRRSIRRLLAWINLHIDIAIDHYDGMAPCKLGTIK